MNAPAAFIHPCRPIVAKQPPSGPGWAHELKHDGYRLQIHIRDGRVRLYTMNAADWSERYPLIVEDAARIKGTAIMDAEVVCAGKDGAPWLVRVALYGASAADLHMSAFDGFHGKVRDCLHTVSVKSYALFRWGISWGPLQ